MRFRFHPVYEVAARLFGVRPETAAVELDDGHLTARFGPWLVRTELSNVTSADVVEGFSWPRLVGPAQVSLADRGLIIATNPNLGTRITFDRPVRGLDPLGLVRHPSLLVTVEDAPALAELLDRSSHDELRNHTPSEAVTTDDLVQEANDELEALTAAELRRRARERGISGVSRLNKADLIR
ncbi:MAG TPA: Rho termination factor N-terminal domain-containing protein, partial [Microthrixaceae bacterium]|nr:Rho termination factor N-terminal domain-containing protein [Microthrixaceae bacterium]